MTLFQIVGFYIAIHLILASVLLIRVAQQRIKASVSIGDGGDFKLLSRIRAQANYTENAPFMLIALIGMAMLSASPWALHIFGGVFTIARILHPIGMDQKNALGSARRIGASLTLATLIGASGYLFYLIFWGPGAI